MIGLKWPLLCAGVTPRMIYFAYALLMYNMWVCANVELAQFRWDGEPVIAQIVSVSLFEVPAVSPIGFYQK